MRLLPLKHSSTDLLETRSLSDLAMARVCYMPNRLNTPRPSVWEEDEFTLEGHALQNALALF